MTLPKQGTEEWIQWRKSKLGASDIAAVMGVSPWTTQYQLWTYKMGIAEPQMNAAMQRGTDMEEEARNAFIDHIGIHVAPIVWEDDIYDWCIASFDGVSEDRKTIVEIKCPGKLEHEITSANSEPPVKYIPQLQHQLYICGLPKMYYFSYRSPDDFVCLEVERDDDYIMRMLKSEKEFYKCMMEFTPPPLTDRDYVDMSDDVKWEIEATVFKKLKERKQQVDAEYEVCKLLLIDLSEGKNCKGCGVRVTKYPQKGRVDYAKIPELEKVDLEKYRKPAIECYKITELGKEEE